MSSWIILFTCTAEIQVTMAEKARMDLSTVGRKISPITLSLIMMFLYRSTVLVTYFMLCVQRTRMVCLCEGRMTKRFRMVFVYCLVSCFTGPGFQHTGASFSPFSPMLLYLKQSLMRNKRSREGGKLQEMVSDCDERCPFLF